MSAQPASAPDLDPLRALTEAAARAAGSPASVASVVTLLAVADRLQARAAGMLAEGIDREAGLPAEHLLRLDTRKVHWEAREFAAAGDAFRALPQLAEAVAAGWVSWSQTRAILRECRRLRAGEHQAVDALIGDEAPTLQDAEPEALLDRVTDEVCRLEAARLRRREERAITTSYLVLQQRLDGSGGTLFGEADAESFATIATALDAAAADPVNPETHPDAPTRAQQRLQALVGLCESSLSGASGGSQRRSKPKILVNVDLRDLNDPDAGGLARILCSVPGRPIRISALTADVMACDALIAPIVFRDGQPIGVGDSRDVIPEKVRAALEARDGGCRFPGCRAPAAWSDAHHRRWRKHGGDNRIGNLVLLCRRCHRLVHEQGWKIRLLADGAIEFRHRRRRYVSYPRGRPPPRTSPAAFRDHHTHHPPGGFFSVPETRTAQVSGTHRARRSPFDMAGVYRVAYHPRGCPRAGARARGGRCGRADVSYETLLYEEKNKVAWVTLNRPEVHNAFDPVMQRELRDVWRALRANDDVNAIVLTGAGEKAFCTGIDRTAQFDESGSKSSGSPGATPFMFDDPGEHIGPKSNDLWKPMIAAVNGMACGGAFYMLGESDIIIAVEDATFFDPHVSYGMTASFESIHMAQRMPLGEVLRMQLLGLHERMSAERAHQIGLVSEVVPRDRLAEAAGWVAETIAAQPPLAIQGTLRAIWGAREMGRTQALDQGYLWVKLGTSRESLAEGQRSFASGERPRWRLR